MKKQAFYFGGIVVGLLVFISFLLFADKEVISRHHMLISMASALPMVIGFAIAGEIKEKGGDTNEKK
jgi:hypothetical protein